MTTDYEVIYIVRPNLEETEVDTRVEQIAEVLRKSGGEPGEIDKMGSMGRYLNRESRRLASMIARIAPQIDVKPSTFSATCYFRSGVFISHDDR